MIRLLRASDREPGWFLLRPHDANKAALAEANQAAQARLRDAEVALAQARARAASEAADRRIADAGPAR